LDEAASPEALRFRLTNGTEIVSFSLINDSKVKGNGCDRLLLISFPPHSAGDLFLTAIKEGHGVSGYVCGTLTKRERLTHESMQTHDDDGTVLCIHSVCVSSSLRRQKIGLRLLKAYISTIKLVRPNVRSVRLIAKPYLIPFYELAGFKVVGPSDIVHGKDQWIECALSLDPESEVRGRDCD
jgi:GNAT superfamily N-acetyltransferase